MHIFNETVFRAYDVRGRYPQQISPAFANWLGKVTGQIYHNVIVGTDNRPSSPRLKREFINGLVSADVHVIDSGVGPADMHLSAGKYYDVDLIVNITASHLGKDMNGFRFAHKLGNGILPQEWQEIKDIFFGRKTKKHTAGKGNIVDKSQEIRERYLFEIEEHFRKISPHSRIDARIVVDAGGGTALTAEILRRLGAEVYEANYTRNPEPTHENLAPLSAFVKENDFDLAVAHDIDADRIAALDANGEWISTDELFGLFVDLMVKNGDDVVSTIDVSQAVNEFIEMKGAKVHICRVGDSFVSDMMLQKNAILGGEPSAHYFYLPLTAFSSGAFFAALLSAVAKKVPEMRKKIPQRFTARRKFSVGDKGKWDKIQEIRTIAKNNYDLISDIDGAKFKINGGSALVRPSNTEDVIRITVETDSKQKSEKTLEDLRKELGL